MLLVAGVFLGMQVSNWNPAQADARLGSDYVQRLIRDLEQDLLIRANVEYYAAVLKSIEEKDTAGSSHPDPRSLVVNAYRATEDNYRPPSRATWDQIVSSGHLGLLPAGAANQGCRNTMHSNSAGRYRGDHLPTADGRKIMPLGMQIAMRAGCSDVRDEREIDRLQARAIDTDRAALKGRHRAAKRSRRSRDLRYQYSYAVGAASTSAASTAISRRTSPPSVLNRKQSEGVAMILRRLAQSLKQQNWTSIWIEFVLLVAGVFLGIQVSNWNEERETKQRAAVFTERLRDDLRKEAWAYEDLIQYSRETNASQRRVLDALAGDVALSEDQFLISAYRATQYIYNVRFRATYDELVYAAIGLISDDKLRDTAMSIFTTPLLDQILQGARESEYRHLFRETVSAEVQQDLLDRCGDHYATVLDYSFPSWARSTIPAR